MTKKLGFFTVIVAYLALGTTKIGVLLFYKRVFITRRFFLAANAVMVLVIGWTLAAIFVSTLPLERKPGEPILTALCRLTSSRHGPSRTGGTVGKRATCNMVLS